MEEFSSQIFKENKQKTRDVRFSKEKVYYIGIIIFLVSIVFYLLDLEEFSTYLGILGIIVLTVGRIVMSGRLPVIGHKPYRFTIMKDGILIGTEKINLDVTKDIKIFIHSYRGEAIGQRTAFYQTYAGTENTLKFTYQNMETEFNFVLHSEIAKEDLVDFCEEHQIIYEK